MIINFANKDIEIIPSQTFDFLLTNREVAKGYGIDERAIRDHKSNHQEELIESKHFINVNTHNQKNFGVILHPKVRSQTFWTKKGIVRLGFFIKSERAKVFRQWVENLTVLHEQSLDITDIFSKTQYSDLMSKHIYVVQVSNGAIKIGISSDTKQRFSQIESNCGFDITKQFTSEQTAKAYKIEQFLLAYFDDYRINGEWLKNITFEKVVEKLKSVFAKHHPETIKLSFLEKLKLI